MSLHVIEVTIGETTVEVQRCAMCDTSPCPHCASRTLDPRAGECRHCKGHTGLKKPDEKEADPHA